MEIMHTNNNPNQPKGQGREDCSKTINKYYKLFLLIFSTLCFIILKYLEVGLIVN